ncbi:hypothetical protein C3L33_10250, partial [Rhododendron williamsianum]
MVKRQVRGSIICTASAASVLGGLGPIAYNTSKHGLVGLVRAAASELGKHGIRVNCVSPYFVATPLAISGMSAMGINNASGIEALASSAGNLKGVALKAKHIAEAALFLASDESSVYVSGHNLVVDGGYTVVDNSIIFLLELLPSKPPSYIRVAEEHHDDGSPHVHCLIQFPYKFQTINRQFFDLTSAIGSEQYHGNYQAARDAATVNDYIAKEGVFVEHGEFIGRKQKSSADVVYREAISQDNTESALEVIRQGAPCDYVINFDKVKTNLNRIYKKPPTPYTNPFSDFENIPAIMTEWAHENIRDPAYETPAGPQQGPSP